MSNPGRLSVQYHKQPAVALFQIVDQLFGNYNLPVPQIPVGDKPTLQLLGVFPDRLGEFLQHDPTSPTRYIVGAHPVGDRQQHLVRRQLQAGNRLYGVLVDRAVDQDMILPLAVQLSL